MSALALFDRLFNGTVQPMTLVEKVGPSALQAKKVYREDSL